MPVVSRTRSLTESIRRMVRAASRLLLLAATAASISKGQEFFARVIASTECLFFFHKGEHEADELVDGVSSWRSDSLVVVISSAAGSALLRWCSLVVVAMLGCGSGSL